MTNKLIYQTKKGITLKDGFYLVRNPKTQKINVISISNQTVYLHDVTRHMKLSDLIHYDTIGYFDIFETLQMTEKEKSKQKKDNNK